MLRWEASRTRSESGGGGGTCLYFVFNTSENMSVFQTRAFVWKTDRFLACVEDNIQTCSTWLSHSPSLQISGRKYDLPCCMKGHLEMSRSTWSKSVRIIRNVSKYIKYINTYHQKCLEIQGVHQYISSLTNTHGRFIQSDRTGIGQLLPGPRTKNNWQRLKGKLLDIKLAHGESSISCLEWAGIKW